MSKKLFIIIVLLTGMAISAVAQKPDTVKVKSRKDSLNRKRDSVTSKPFTPPKTTKIKKYNPDSTHSPGLAFRRSLMIPGWGQAYNRSWWKLPFIYSGLGVLGYNIVQYRKESKMYAAIYRLRIDPTLPRLKPDDPYYDEYNRTLRADPTAIDDQRSNSDRNFQITILSFAAVWGVQAIEAYIQAKFIHSYTMDTDLSFKVSPSLITPPVYAANNIGTFTPGLKVTFTIK